ncbi:hypothetical protein EVA_21925, partial [gut metagenome]
EKLKGNVLIIKYAFALTYHNDILLII